MADLLIRGMEMPKSCAECFADDNGWCNILGCSIGDSAALRMIGRRDDCPLAEVPDHGRLCDLDAFMEEINQTCLALGNAGVVITGDMLWAKLWDAYENADTIIPASKESGE